MGYRNPLVGVVHNAQHAQSASTRVHGVVCEVNGRFSGQIPSLYCPVEDDEEDHDDEDEEEEGDDGVGRFLRR